MGLPNSSWTDDKINDYEAKLNRLAVVESNMTSDDDIIVFGRTNEEFISQGHRLIAQARQEKRDKIANDEENRERKKEYSKIKDEEEKRQKLAQLETEREQQKIDRIVNEYNNVLAKETDKAIEKVNSHDLKLALSDTRYEDLKLYDEKLNILISSLISSNDFLNKNKKYIMNYRINIEVNQNLLDEVRSRKSDTKKEIDQIMEDAVNAI